MSTGDGETSEEGTDTQKEYRMRDSLIEAHVLPRQIERDTALRNLYGMFTENILKSVWSASTAVGMCTLESTFGIDTSVSTILGL